MPNISPVPPIKRRDLAKLTLTSLHQARNWSKADVSMLEWPEGSGQQLVIKDFARRPLWFRVVLARALLKREWRTLRALHDVPEVPTAYQRIDPDAFIMDYCQGKQIHSVKPTEMPQGLVSNIEDLIKIIHARGVTHGDLHTSNILITHSKHQFALIDWATACYFGPQPRGWRKVLFHELSALDDRAMAKLKVIYQPHSLTPNQRNLLLNGGSAIYHKFKAVRHFFERLRGQDRSVHRANKVQHYQNRLDQTHHSQPPGNEHLDQ